MSELKWLPNPNGGESCILKNKEGNIDIALYVYKSYGNWMCVGPGFFTTLSGDKPIGDAKDFIVNRSIERANDQLELLVKLRDSMREEFAP